MEELRGAVEGIRDEEQECLDSIPENLVSSSRYEDMENAIGNLESAIDWFDSADIEELTSYLEEAKQ